MRNSVTTLLERCLAARAAGGSAEDVLAEVSNPRREAAVRELLESADVARVLPGTMGRASRSDLRERLLSLLGTASETVGTSDGRSAPMIIGSITPRRLALRAAAVVAALALLTNGIVAIAAESVHGDTLHPIRLAAERLTTSRLAHVILPSLLLVEPESTARELGSNGDSDTANDPDRSRSTAAGCPDPADCPAPTRVVRENAPDLSVMTDSNGVADDGSGVDKGLGNQLGTPTIDVSIAIAPTAVFPLIQTPLSTVAPTLLPTATSPAPTPSSPPEGPEEPSEPSPIATDPTSTEPPATEEPTPTETEIAPPSATPISTPDATSTPGGCMASIRGQLTDADGSAVAGAIVSIHRLVGGIEPAVKVTSDASGAYEVGGLCAGEYKAFALIESAMQVIYGYYDPDGDDVPDTILLPEPWTIAESIDIALIYEFLGPGAGAVAPIPVPALCSGSGLRIEGQVRWDRSPVEGIQVMAFGDSGATAGLSVADGTYALEDLCAEYYVIFASVGDPPMPIGAYDPDGDGDPNFVDMTSVGIRSGIDIEIFVPPWVTRFP